jgi:ferrous iron transport protein A
MTLAQLPRGASATVVSVSAPADAPEWAEWLEALGFLPGERVRVVTHGVPGGDPLVVRVGDSTFALRRSEAACVTIRA